MRALTRLFMIVLVCSSSALFADSFGSPNFVLYGITSLLINDSLNETTPCAIGNIGGASVSLDKCLVVGNVSVPTASAFTKGSHGAITGTVFAGSLASVNSGLIAQSAMLAAMTGTSLGNITTNQTLTPGVYSVGNINFSGGNRSITLNGAGKYIFNVSGNILWAASKLILENGATASNVIFNITSTNSNSVWNKDTTTWQATILDPRGNVEIHNAFPLGNFTGQVFANNINFHSAATIIQPPAPPPEVPEPSSLLLLGTGLVAGAGVLRRKAAARFRHSDVKVLGVEPMQVPELAPFGANRSA